MSDPTPTERARELFRGWPSSDEVTATEVVSDLLAHPGLLVDLAIEAGGLEQVGWYDPGLADDLDHPFHLLDPEPEDHAVDVADPTLEPVYRRTPMEENDEQPDD